MQYLKTTVTTEAIEADSLSDAQGKTGKEIDITVKIAPRVGPPLQGHPTTGATHADLVAATAKLNQKSATPNVATAK